MSDGRPEPLDPELDALLEAERSAVPSADALDRVWSRLSLAALPSRSGGRSTAGTGAGSTGSSTAWLAPRAIGVAAATFVAGGLASAGLHAILQKAPPERVVYVERPVTSAPHAATPPVIASVPAPSAARSFDPSPAARASVHSSPPAAPSLAAERALLDDARGALGSGDAARALALTEEHGRRFPRAQLGEEREAIAIQALVALGRNDEARARAARFRAAAPNSLFLPAIEASLDSIP